MPAPTVSALRERSRDRVEVELDGEPWRVVPAVAVVRAGLAVGRPLDRVRARQLGRELRRVRALTRAARVLAAGDRSRRELVERLDRAGLPADAREQALASLERAGLVDDERLARSRADAMARRGYGDAAIRADLGRRGIAPAVAGEAIEALDPEPERARRLLERGGAGPRELRRLAARGFDRETVRELAGFADET
ncbi:MAG TPA: regulatory protein RecX [Gaiellaceae bacterium]|nr:regulatory protein RecX [Gaiellaceae bacterium]